MMAWRPTGLSIKFSALAIGALAVLLIVVVVMLQRQRVMQSEVARVGAETMRAQVTERLRERGETSIVQLAHSLVNPMYYFDLDTIGALVRDTMRQPDVSYVVVYDTKGSVIHDGSGDIPTYGRAMDDPLAYEVVSARGPHAQWADNLLDVSAPISVGGERLGGVRIGYSLQSLHTDEHRAASSMVARLDEVGRRHLTWIMLLLLLLVIGVLATGVILQRTLVRPIRQLASAAREIEAGNFDAEVPASWRSDEVGDLLRAFGRMGGSLARHDRDIRRMAYTDSLTGLSNRLAFRENLERKVVQQQGAGLEMALLFVDIDDFKRVNDSLGHDAGDEVLVQFASRIREAVDRHGGEHAMLSRFGGDEFVVLLEGDARSRIDFRVLASRVADNLVSELSRPIQLGGRQVFLGTSIGIALFPGDASDAAMLMKSGDIAMYQAKMDGKNCYRFFSRAMDLALTRRSKLEDDLHQAWDHGHLTLSYQPVFRLSDRALVGAEALLRWQHPEHGDIAPSTFIDIAEQSGLIDRIGTAVLRIACRDAATWQTPGRGPVFVSVNVSPRQLRSGDFSRRVMRVLQDSGLPASALHLELTETTLIDDDAETRQLLAQLREHGVGIWLDDFGTGFSGLNHLRRVPVDGLKVDRSFVSGIAGNAGDLALTNAVIAMAHALGVQVIAEGIEDAPQYDLLQQRHCDMGQGYWLGHPMEAEDFAALLKG